MAASLLGPSCGEAHAGDARVSERDAAGWLREWDAQGHHRTGTDGDEAGATWLEREAAALGATVTRETFAFERVDPIDAWLEIDGHRIDAVLVFDAPATGPDGIAGALGPSGGDAPIGVAELSPQSVYSGEYKSLRRQTRHRALVIVCQGAHPGMGLLNAEQFRTPYGTPAIHVASEAREPVFAAVARGASARVIAHCRRCPATACNVVVVLPGRDRARTPVAVMTPRSSWWQSTAERGGGLVCWLETLRALLANPPAMDVVMTANSGHELGHLGLDDFIARRPGWDRDALWLHWGANLGAAGGSLTVMSASNDLRAAAVHALTEARQPPDALAPARGGFAGLSGSGVFGSAVGVTCFTHGELAITSLASASVHSGNRLSLHVGSAELSANAATLAN